MGGTVEVCQKSQTNQLWGLVSFHICPFACLSVCFLKRNRDYLVKMRNLAPPREAHSAACLLWVGLFLIRDGAHHAISSPSQRIRRREVTSLQTAKSQLSLIAMMVNHPRHVDVIKQIKPLVSFQMAISSAPGLSVVTAI